MKGENCVFCKIVNREIKSEIIENYDNFIVIKDLNPVSEGHCLIISKKHYENVFHMPDILGTELIEIVKEQGLRLIKEKKAEGIKLVQNNGGAAGQVVMHYHLHVIPEKESVKREKFV